MKKFISVLLAFMLVFSLTTVAFSAYNVVDEGVTTIAEALEAAEYDGPIARVYFMMPNGHNGDFGSDGTQPVSWLNDYNLLDGVHYAGIYWWGGPGACGAWPGYRMEVENVDECIYYADIPGDDEITTVVFNNGVDGGMDPEDPIYDKANQTSDCNVEGAGEDEYDTIPMGTINEMDFDGFIYIVDQDQVDENPVSHRLTAGGNWYAYYGNGCYGNYAESQDGFVSVEENCLNPNHFDAAGNHIGYHEDVPEPTDAPTPTEAPTDPPHVHTPGEAVEENTVPATYKAPGSYDEVVYCTECGEELSRETKEIPQIVLDSNKLYFDAASSGWNMGAKNKIAFHIYGGDLTNGLDWGAKKSIGTATAGTTGLWEIDPANGKQGYTLNPGVQYKIIFAYVDGANWVGQTYDLLFTTDCLGHVAYCNGTQYENPVDSTKKTLAAFWYEMDASEVGPVLQISSIGNVVGTCPEAGKTAESIFIDFISVIDSTTGVTKLDNAREYVVDVGTKTEQQLIDDIGTDLGLTKQQVYDAFTNNNVATTWDYTVSTLPGDVVPPTEAVEPTAEPTQAPEPTVEPTQAVEPTDEPTPEDTYVVAGVKSVFTSDWNPNDANNALVKGDDGLYTKTYTVGDAIENVQFKVVKNGTEWIGDATGNNVTFDLTAAGDFTITFNPETNAITVTGDNVFFKTDFEYDAVYAVGNGTDGSSWLNCISWTPNAEDNKMTEIEPDVWYFESTVGEFDPSNIEFKFAVDGEWTHNFGLAEGADLTLGTEMDAAYNGQNLVINNVVPGTVVKMTLDLSAFDFASKTGAKMTIVTEAPTEPTQAVEPTVEPTAEPTQAVEPTTEPTPDDTYVVAGVKSVFTSDWNPNDANNALVKGDDGLYTKTYTVGDAIENVQFKVVKNGTEWIGDATGNNVTFDLTGAGDFTITFDPETNAITVTGDNVFFKTDFEYDAVYAVGNGTDGSSWLNCISWTPNAEDNKMTEIEPDVWYFESTVGEFDPSNIEFKFAVDGEWTHNFGLAEGADLTLGTEMDAAYNGQNLVINNVVPGTVVKMTLDLSAFDFASKTGAKMTIVLETPTEPTQAVEPTVEPTQAVEPTEPAPSIKPQTYYLIGTIAAYDQNWSLDPALELTEVEAGTLYKIEHVELIKAEKGVDAFGNPIEEVDGSIIGDSFKVVQSNKKGTDISYYYPDGVHNNRTVPEDGTYTIWFRPNGDGTAEDGWQYVYTTKNGDEDAGAHGCKNGGYMFKIVNESTPEPTQAVEPTVEPTQAPEPTVEPTQAVEPTEPVTGDTYVVAGVKSVFTSDWNPNDANNALVKGDDGLYTKTYTVGDAIENVQFKVVKNGTEWIGDATGNNVTFDLTGAGDFTITFNPETNAITVTGDNVFFKTDFEYDAVYAVGNGTDGSSWLNCISWTPNAEDNKMTETDPDVWYFESTVGEFDPSSIEFKFAIDGEWTHNFGLAEGADLTLGTEMDAAYNGQNLVINNVVPGTVVKMTLDLSAFDFASKTGAKMTIVTVVPGAYMLGDADGNEDVESIDATLVQRYDVHMAVNYSEEQMMHADVTGDGELDITDVTYIQRFLAMMATPYAIGEWVNP